MDINDSEYLCPECGKMIQSYDKFCKYCGVSFNETVKVAEQSFQPMNPITTESENKEVNTENIITLNLSKILGIGTLLVILFLIYLYAFFNIYTNYKLKNHTYPGLYMIYRDDQGHLRGISDPRAFIELARNNPKVGNEIVKRAQEAIEETNTEAFTYGISTGGIGIGLLILLFKRIKKGRKSHEKVEVK